MYKVRNTFFVIPGLILFKDLHCLYFLLGLGKTLFKTLSTRFYKLNSV